MNAEQRSALRTAKAKIRTQTLTLTYEDPRSLVPAEYNPRTISQAAMRRLERGIRAYGFVDPVLCRKEDRLIIGGHQRTQAGLAIGMEAVPVTWVVGLSDLEAKALNVLLNNAEAGGEFDAAKLAEVLSELQDVAYDATLTGFDAEQVTKMLTAGAEPAATDGGVQVTQEGYAVLVTCKTEGEQAALLERFVGEGLDCRALLT